MGPHRTVGLGLGLQMERNGTGRDGRGGFKRAGSEATEKQRCQCTGGREHVSTWHCVAALHSRLFTIPPRTPTTPPSSSPIDSRPPRLCQAEETLADPTGEEIRRRGGGASSMPRHDMSLPDAFKLVLGKGSFGLVWIFPFFFPVS